MITRSALAIQAAGSAVVAYVLLLNQWAEFKFPRWLKDTGDYSYTLYVTHFPLLVLGLSVSLSINHRSFPLAIAAAILSAVPSLVVVILAARWLEDVPKYKGYLSSVFIRRKAELAA